MTPAIHFTSIGSSDTGREVFGLHVAVTDWLRAYFQYGSPEKFHFLIGAATEWEHVLKIAHEAHLDSQRIIGLDRRYPRDNFVGLDVIFRLNADTQRLLWQRQLVPNGFAFCGLTHTVAGIEAGEVLEQYCLAPSESRDALVCPSFAVKKVITTFWNLYGDYLRERFGTTYHCPVQLPVIPLGVDLARFEKKVTPEKRREQREKLGLKDDDIILLWVGRFSHAIKAHPLAMFQAAERAAEKTGVKIHLVMLGYSVPEGAEIKFAALAEDICRQAKVTFVAHSDPRFPDGLWAAGDIFLSLIDNMQESFGLTPIEAMAAGLPRVVSDWNGYRDCVTHGEDGFLIRTTQPPPGSGTALSELLLNGREVYGGFLAKTALSVAVDQEMAAETIALLIRDKGKRRSLADKARARARATYDWKNIISAYEALWQEQSKRQKSEGKSHSWPSPLPQAPDPYRMYAAYPSAALKETDHIAVATSREEIKKLWRHDINVFALDVMISAEEATELIHYVSTQGETTIDAIFRTYSPISHDRLWRTIGWLIKLGIFRHKSNP